MLQLKPPAWANQFLITSSSSSSSFTSSTSPALAPSPSPASPFPPPISDLVLSLTNRRLHREIALCLRTGLHDAKADFSFLRVKGLKILAKFLAAVAKSDTMIQLFQESQSDPTLQVVPVLFEHSLAPRRLPSLPADLVNCEETPQVMTPPTDYEVALALRVLEGCCLLDRASRIVADQHMAVKEVIELLSAGGVLEQGACVDALLALMLDNSVNQEQFIRYQGLQKISDLVKNVHVEEKMRLKCAEFLLLLVGNVLPSGVHEDIESENSNVSAEDAQEELQAFLGIELALLLEKAELMKSFSGTQETESSVHLQAKQLVELLDSSDW